MPRVQAFKIQGKITSCNSYQQIHRANSEIASSAIDNTHVRLVKSVAQ
jgi:hypothetical protein